jgi:hypothetical protein
LPHEACTKFALKWLVHCAKVAREGLEFVAASTAFGEKVRALLVLGTDSRGRFCCAFVYQIGCVASCRGAAVNEFADKCRCEAARVRCHFANAAHAIDHYRFGVAFAAACVQTGAEFRCKSTQFIQRVRGRTRIAPRFAAAVRGCLRVGQRSGSRTGADDTSGCRQYRDGRGSNHGFFTDSRPTLARENPFGLYRLERRAVLGGTGADANCYSALPSHDAVVGEAHTVAAARSAPHAAFAVHWPVAIELSPALLKRGGSFPGFITTFGGYAGLPYEACTKFALKWLVHCAKVAREGLEFVAASTAFGEKVQTRFVLRASSSGCLVHARIAGGGRSAVCACLASHIRAHDCGPELAAQRRYLT